MPVPKSPPPKTRSRSLEPEMKHRSNNKSPLKPLKQNFLTNQKPPSSPHRTTRFKPSGYRSPSEKMSKSATSYGSSPEQSNSKSAASSGYSSESSSEKIGRLSKSSSQDQESGYGSSSAASSSTSSTVDLQDSNGVMLFNPQKLNNLKTSNTRRPLPNRSYSQRNRANPASNKKESYSTALTTKSQSTDSSDSEVPASCAAGKEPTSSNGLVFKMLKNESKLVKAVLTAHGFRQTGPHDLGYKLLWAGSHLKPYCYRSMTEDQRVNHFPRSFELTRKDRLYRNVEKMQHQHGKENFDFIPQFFVTPEEFDKFKKVLDKEGHRSCFIVKPVGSSRGRGIFLTQNSDDIPLGSPLLISRYISNPYLINGHKFDIRLYVAVTSIHPLVAYLYQDGLVRLATEKYSNNFSRTSGETYIHLTNYSLNKFNKKFMQNDHEDSEDTGHKWSLGAFLRHLREEDKMDPELMMLRIEDLIIKTLLSVQSSIGAACLSFVPYDHNSFELFGFDILMDANLKPWLLEVNLSPSLSCDSLLDYRIKSPMICDLLSIAGIPSPPTPLKPDSEHNETSPKPQSTSKPITTNKNGYQNYKKIRAENSTQSPGGGTKIMADHALPLIDKEAASLKVKTRKRLPGHRSASSKAVRRARSQMLKRQIQHSQGKLAPMSKSRPHADLMTAHKHRLIGEEVRRGGFQRIFPRTDTWPIYSEYLEELGSDDRQFDLELHRNLYGDQMVKSSHSKKKSKILEIFRDPETYRTLRNDVPSTAKTALSDSIKRCRFYERKIQVTDLRRISFPKLKLDDSYKMKRSESVDNPPTSNTVTLPSMPSNASSNSLSSFSDRARRRSDKYSREDDLKDMIMTSLNEMDKFTVPPLESLTGKTMKRSYTVTPRPTKEIAKSTGLPLQSGTPRKHPSRSKSMPDESFKKLKPGNSPRRESLDGKYPKEEEEDGPLLRLVDKPAYCE